VLSGMQRFETLPYFRKAPVKRKCRKLKEKKCLDLLWSSRIAMVFLPPVQTGFDSRCVCDILKRKFFIRNCYKTSHSSEAVPAASEGSDFPLIELSLAGPAVHAELALRSGCILVCCFLFFF